MSNYYEAAAVQRFDKAVLINIIVRRSLRDYFLVREKSRKIGENRLGEDRPNQLVSAQVKCAKENGGNVNGSYCRC